MQITLAGTAYPLSPPTGLAALDVRVSFPGIEREQRGQLIRWSFGVVGIAWAGKRHGWPDLAACKNDVVSFGEQVYQGLAAAGLVRGDADIQAVCDAASEILGAVSPKAEEVQEARDFSSPPSGKTSGEASTPPRG